MSRFCLGLLILVLAAVPDVGITQESARIYVRRIEFQGTEGIADEVLRRALVLAEGTFLDTVALEQSRLQLEQLPYVAEAQVFLRPIDGAINQVDVIMVITQAPARTYGGGAGYSESQRVSVHGFFTNENIFGKGNRFSATASIGDFRKEAEFSHTNPFIGSERVSRTLSLASRQVERLSADATALDSALNSARVDYAYRTGENQTIALGLAINDVRLAADPVVSDQWLDWMTSNGNPGTQGTAFSNEFWTAEFLLRWHQDTRNRQIFPDRGFEQSLAFRSAIPGSEVEYFLLDYESTKHWPLAGRWEARLDSRLGYGAGYGSATSSLPPYLNWFAGGSDSVRGYRGGQLGPQDSLGNPYGGNLFVASQFELVLPLPEKTRERLRVGIFYDVGNVFATEDVIFRDGTGESLDYGFEFSRLRRSAGLSARILIPIGMIRLSYGVPLNADDEHPNPFLRDDTERFQVAIGVDF